MNPGESGKPFRSRAYTYAAGSPINVELDFLSPARQMAAPEISELVFRFSGTVGAVSGGALGRDAAKLYDNVLLRDDGEIVNASGAGLRVLEQIEIGDRQIDPSDISSGATNTTYKYNLRILFGSDAQTRTARGRDAALQLAQFLEGGNLIITPAAAVPTGWAAVQSDWRVRVYAYVRDGRKAELKSRRHIWEQAISLQEFDYPVNGSLRNAVITSKLTTTGYTTLAGYTTLYSRSLELPPTFETDMLVDEYRKTGNALGTNDEITLAAPGAIPLKVAHRGQLVGQMVDLKTLHVDLGAAAPTGGRLLLDVVQDRSPIMGAAALGYETPSALAQAVASRGVIQGANGDKIPATSMVSTIARRTPIRIKGDM